MPFCPCANVGPAYLSKCIDRQRPAAHSCLRLSTLQAESLLQADPLFPENCQVKTGSVQHALYTLQHALYRGSAQALMCCDMCHIHILGYL